MSSVGCIGYLHIGHFVFLALIDKYMQLRQKVWLLGHASTGSFLFKLYGCAQMKHSASKLFLEFSFYPSVTWWVSLFFLFFELLLKFYLDLLRLFDGFYLFGVLGPYFSIDTFYVVKWVSKKYILIYFLPNKENLATVKLSKSYISK